MMLPVVMNICQGDLSCAMNQHPIALNIEQLCISKKQVLHGGSNQLSTIFFVPFLSLMFIASRVITVRKLTLPSLAQSSRTTSISATIKQQVCVLQTSLQIKVILVSRDFLSVFKRNERKKRENKKK